MHWLRATIVHIGIANRSLVDVILLPDASAAGQQTVNELATALDYLRNSTLGLLAAAQDIEQEIQHADPRDLYKLRVLMLLILLLPMWIHQTGHCSFSFKSWKSNP